MCLKEKPQGKQAVNLGSFPEEGDGDQKERKFELSQAGRSAPEQTSSSLAKGAGLQREREREEGSLLEKAQPGSGQRKGGKRRKRKSQLSESVGTFQSRGQLSADCA